MASDGNAYVRSTAEGLADGAACLEAALAYAPLGWSVLCLCPPDHIGIGKSHGRCDSPGKRPVADGGTWKDRQETAADEATIRRWWHQHPNANVGLALGPVSGLVRVDVEGQAAEELLAETSGDDLPPTLEFSSGKGRGLLYIIPEGVEARTGVEGLADGELRIQGLGAQTVLPPSRHVSGRLYAWLPGAGPTERRAAPAPAWLLARLAEGTRRQAGAALTDGELIPQGKRDDTLMRMGCSMRNRGFGESAIRNALSAENAERCDPPLDDAQVAKIARSVARYEPDAYHSATILRAAPGVNGTPVGKSVFGPPIPMSQLRRVADEAKWLWHGYLSYGGITLLSSLWKAGKTTLQSHLLKAFEQGGYFCGTVVQAAKVLYVTEEHESLWAERRDEIGLSDWVEVLIRPFGGKPDSRRWGEFLTYLQGLCAEKGYGVVVFDTISNLWPVQDENDAAKVQAALMPLRAVSDSVAFLLDHHVRKSDGPEATAARGSGAFPAFVDTILELRRYAPSDRKDTRRVLTGYGRYRETPAEVVLEFTGSGFRCLGEKEDLRNAGLHADIMEIIPGEAPGYTATQIHAAWLGEPIPSVKTVRAALRAGAEAGFWVEAGEGHGGRAGGNPYRYWRPPK